MRTFDGMLGLTHGFNLRRNASNFPDKMAVIDVEQDKRYTYRQFNERVNRLGNALLEQGVSKGDKVAMLMGDRVEFLEFMYALNKIGAVWVPMNYRSLADDVEYVVNNSDAGHVVYTGEFANIIDAVRDNFKNVKRDGYICVGDKAVEGSLFYDAMMEGGSAREPDVDVLDSDLCSMIYTSGTTGGPKGAMRTHRTSLGWAFDAIIGFDLSFSDVMLNPFPLFHQGGSVLSLVPLTLGGTVVIPGPFDPIKMLNIIQTENVTSAAFAATMSNFMMKLPESELNKYDLSSMRRYINGASALLTDTKNALLEHFPNIQLYEHLSTTEAFYVVLPFEEIRSKDRCVGLPAFGMEVKLLTDGGGEAPRGEAGIIYGRGISVFNGYYNNQEANEKAFQGEWFTAEDVGRFDEDGYLYVVDRKKDMILTGGENVASIDVEDKLINHPKVAEVAVIGVPDEKWGERVHAELVLKPGVEASEQEIMEWCRDKLAGYKRPRSVEFVKGLPKNPAGKILKRELRKKYWGDSDLMVR
ncbi:MAG: hypothetical protein C4582_00345 [Desulfobacteraceae bacterium]|nr:MAG: hypothetical protein C4582_00345 [Desulfobacteraceae bacterium]